MVGSCCIHVIIDTSMNQTWGILAYCQALLILYCIFVMFFCLFCIFIVLFVLYFLSIFCIVFSLYCFCYCVIFLVFGIYVDRALFTIVLGHAVATFTMFKDEHSIYQPQKRTMSVTSLVLTTIELHELANY